MGPQPSVRRAARVARPARHSALRSPAGVLVLGLIVLLALGGSTPVVAQDRSIVIEEMHAVYRVQENGDVSVEERFRVRFNGSWNGLSRVISLRPPAGYPWEEPVGFLLESTTNGENEPRRNEVLREGAYLRDVRVYVPDANDRTADVVIRYTLMDALGFYAAAEERGLPAMDEFYWAVTSTEWEAPIRAVTAEVMLPSSAEISQAAAYQGGAMSRNQVPVTLDGSVMRTASEGTIRPGEGLSIGVGWPPGAVRRDPARVMAWGDASLQDRLAGSRPGPLTYLPLLLPMAVFWLAYRAWDRRGRDPKERSIVVRWEPPEELSPAEAGTLVDHSPQMHDIISTLVELAVKGYVIIEERDKKGFLQFGKDYVFHLIRPEDEWEGLLPHQERFLEGLFKHRVADVGGLLKEALGFDEDATVGAPPAARASVKLSDLKNEFYKEIPEIKDAIFDNLVRKGHYQRRPDKVRGAWIGGAVVLGGGGIAAAVLLTSSGTASPWLGITLGASAAISALIVGIFGMMMPARTEKGARTREAALGFKQFLEKVENPRFKRMIKSPDQFEEYLPYAMAFQCQEQWARAFEDLLTDPPDWYRGGHGHFHATAFASDMGTMATTAGTAMASSPGGSGSGGGGSVGGAGGGGGGGGGF